jgi:glycosyltransferase involved in cell wall biosynthesis
MTINLGIVVPCYNEEAVLPETKKRLLDLLMRLTESGKASRNSAIYFVDDGSRDRTWEMIQTFSAQDTRIHGIKLSRNYGHQNALLAGLFDANGDALVTVDADLQDDIDAIETMVQLLRDGYEIVCGVRRSRDTDTLFKRKTAQAYYRLLKWMGVELIHDHADFRLMSRRAVESLRQFPETNLFLRGIIPLLGLPTAQVYYNRSSRYAGGPKYSLRRMLALAMNGITSFSVMPLRLITGLGLLVCLFSFGMIVWIFWGYFISDTLIPGWASTIIPIYFLGGVQLLSIGILGEYVAKTYMETKRRPRYLIEKVAGSSIKNKAAA